MNTAQFAKLFTINDSVWKRNLEGITHDESLILPTGGGNGINWIAGHTVLTRNLILTILGREPFWLEPDLESVYGRGQTLADADRAAAFDTILARWDESQPLLLEGLQATPAERLAAPSESELPCDTVGEEIAFLHFHETYHLGQLGLLRRIVGKPGAIA